MITWDENKRQSNLRKHGLDFSDCDVLWDNPTISKEDDRVEYGEQRIITMGIIKVGVIVVVHTETINEETRIISARKATKYEQRYYYSNI